MNNRKTQKHTRTRRTPGSGSSLNAHVNDLPFENLTAPARGETSRNRRLRPHVRSTLIRKRSSSIDTIVSTQSFDDGAFTQVRHPRLTCPIHSLSFDEQVGDSNDHFFRTLGLFGYAHGLSNESKRSLLLTGAKSSTFYNFHHLIRTTNDRIFDLTLCVISDIFDDSRYNHPKLNFYTVKMLKRDPTLPFPLKCRNRPISRIIAAYAFGNDQKPSSNVHNVIYYPLQRSISGIPWKDVLHLLRSTHTPLNHVAMPLNISLVPWFGCGSDATRRSCNKELTFCEPMGKVLSLLRHWDSLSQSTFKRESFFTGIQSLTRTQRWNREEDIVSLRRKELADISKSIYPHSNEDWFTLNS